MMEDVKFNERLIALTAALAKQAGHFALYVNIMNLLRTLDADFEALDGDIKSRMENSTSIYSPPKESMIYFPEYEEWSALREKLKEAAHVPLYLKRYHKKNPPATPGVESAGG